MLVRLRLAGCKNQGIVCCKEKETAVTKHEWALLGRGKVLPFCEGPLEGLDRTTRLQVSAFYGPTGLGNSYS